MSEWPISPGTHESGDTFVPTMRELCPDCARELVPVIAEQRIRSFCLHCYRVGSAYLFWSRHTCGGGTPRV